jgi:heme/copper-type cytochrome/quinol oxidase subunit 2
MTRFRVCLLVLAAVALSGPARTQQTPHHAFTIVARRYAFEPARLDVHEQDLVRVTLRTEDIPHSFVIDALRVSKRTVANQPVTFELFADRVGEFRFYCNLTLEDGCRNMNGQLVVRPDAELNTVAHLRRPAAAFFARPGKYPTDPPDTLFPPARFAR